MVIAEKDQNFKAPINQIVDLVVSDDKLKNYIDTTIESSIGDFKNEVNQSISELTSKINNLDSKITTVNNRITNLESSIDDIEQSITSINNKITNIENNLGNVGELLDEEYITQLINKLISENKISVLDPVQQAMNKGTGVTLALPSANSGKISLPIWTGTEAEYNQLTKVAGNSEKRGQQFIRSYVSSRDGQAADEEFAVVNYFDKTEAGQVVALNPIT